MNCFSANFLKLKVVHLTKFRGGENVQSCKKGNKMKRLILIFCAAIALFSSCRNDSEQLSLKERINTANSEDVIDLGKEDLKIEETDSYTISKPLTIKNGNVKNAKFTVESDNVVFDSLENINIVTVHKKVEDGTFSLRNCYDVSEVCVNGGGKNSIHIAKTTIEKLIVNKKGVRVVLSGDGSAKVVEALVSEDCKLDSEDEGNSFEKVVIEKTVEKLELAGKTNVGNISSSERAGSPVIKIIVSVDVKIGEADETVKKSIKETSGNEEFNKKNPDVSESGAESSDVQNLDFVVVDKNKYIISEKSDVLLNDVVPYSVGTISEINVEKTDSEVIVTNSAASEDYLKTWDYWMFSKTPVKAEKGKNYKISFDLKAEKTSRIYLSARDALTLDDSIFVEYNVGTEYETYSVETGAALSDWAIGVSQIAIGSASKLYIKNYKIEEISEQRIGYSIYIADKNDSISCKSAENSISVTFRTVKKDGASGVNIYPLLHKVGKLHKVTFDVTCDKEVSDVEIWAHSNATKGDYSDSGYSRFSFGNTKKAVTLYVPAYQETDEDFRTLKIWVATETPCSLTFSNFNSEETDLDSVMKNDESLGLYFAGHILNSDEDNGDWVVVPFDEPVQLSAGAKAKGQILLCGPENWGSVVTIFRVFAEGSVMTKDEGGDDVIFSNDTSEPVSLKFSINEELKVVVNREEIEDIEILESL